MKKAECSEYYSLYDMQNIEKAKIDSDYLGELITNNSNLIWFSIHKYVNISPHLTDFCGISRDDIYQLGCIGFMKSIRAFNTTRGNKFSSFAAITIAREVWHYMRSNYSVMKLPRSVQDMLKQIRKIEADSGCLPPAKELAHLLNIPDNKVERLVKINANIKGLEEDNPSKSNFIDHIEGNDRSDLEAEDKIFLEELISVVKNKISEQEACILKMRMDGVTRAVTAKQLKVSNMKVGRTIQKIKSILVESGFIDNLKGDDEYDTRTNESNHGRTYDSYSDCIGGGRDIHS